MEEYGICLKPVGDQAVLAVFGDSIDEEVNRRVMELDAAIREADVEGVIE